MRKCNNFFSLTSFLEQSPSVLRLQPQRNINQKFEDTAHETGLGWEGLLWVRGHGEWWAWDRVL